MPISVERKAKRGKAVPRGPQEGGAARAGLGAADEADAEAEEGQDPPRPRPPAAQEEQQRERRRRRSRRTRRLRLRLRREDVDSLEADADQLDFAGIGVRGGLRTLFASQFRLEVCKFYTSSLLYRTFNTRNVCIRFGIDLAQHEGCGNRAITDDSNDINKHDGS